MMKKIMIMLLAAAMPAVAAWCEVGDELKEDVLLDGGTTVEMTFTVTSEDEGNKTCQVGNGLYSAIYSYTSGGLEIPGEIKGYTVTRIGDYAFDRCQNLTSVVIPDCVTSIGEGAFQNCWRLELINIPAGVTSIEANTFFRCESLSSIEIPERVTSIGASAFQACSDLTSINIPKGVTRIEESTFSGCSLLESIDIPAGVTSIGASAFALCRSLTSINIPDGVPSIGASAFNACSSLTSIRIPDSVTSIGTYAFYNCSSLTSIIIPTGVTSIGAYAFEDCSALTSIIIPTGVTSIEAYTFYGCKSLTSIDIPAGVTSIGGAAFQNCNSLTSIKIPGNVKSVSTSAFYTYYLEYIDMSEAKDVTFYDWGGDPTTERDNMGIAWQTLLLVPESRSDITGENVVHVDGSGNAVCDNLWIYDGSPFGTPFPLTVKEVTYYRWLVPSDENAYTVCLPYEQPVSDGITAFTLSEKDSEGSLVFTETKGPLEAYKPYLVTVSDEDVSFNATDVQIATIPDEPEPEAAGGYKLFGTTKKIDNATAAEMGAYILQAGNTWKPVSTENTDAYVLPYRAYLVPTADASNAKEIKSVFTNNATGITTLKTVSRDGTTRVYDLNGRRINGGTGRGIYIVNGKKVISHN